MLLQFTLWQHFLTQKETWINLFYHTQFCSTWNFCSQKCVHSAFICVLIVIWYNIYRYIAMYKLVKFSNTIYK